MKIHFAIQLATLVTLAAARPQGGYSSADDYASSNAGLSSGPISPGYSSGPISAGGYGSGGSTAGYDYAAPVAPVVQKHVYVHVPPPENEYVAPQPLQKFAPPQKHYKIVFIKAPTPPAPTVPVLPVVPRDSEKTLIYVLVKRPDEQPPIIVPTPAPTQPAKPEVFFIKYKTQKEAAAASPSPSYGTPDAGAALSSVDYPSPTSLFGSPSASPSSGYGVPSSTASSY